MDKIFSWLWHFIKAKTNVFVKGFVGTTMVSGIFLFNSNINSEDFWFTYLAKTIVACVSGIIGGFMAVLGNDLYHYVKKKIFKNGTKKDSKEDDQKAA